MKRPDVLRAPVSQRALRLKRRQQDSPRQVCLERARLVTQSFKQTEGLPEIIRQALAFRAVMEKITPVILPDELIVGSIAGKEMGAGVYPEAAVAHRLLDELDYLPERSANPFLITEAEKRELREEILPYWKDKQLEARLREFLPAGEDDIMEELSAFIVTEIAGIGHILLNHEKVLALGLEGIAAEAARCSEAAGGAGKRDFYEAVRICLEGVVSFAENYAREAELQAGREPCPLRKAELEEIGRVCRRVPRGPARNVQEALQSIFFVQLAAQIHDYEPSVSVGRLDRLLQPYFWGEPEAGSREWLRLRELIACFYIKLSSVAPLFDSATLNAFGGMTAFANVVSGGVDREGKDATGAFSYLVVDAARIKTPQPNLGIRLHRETPDDFASFVSELAVQGLIAPQFFHDETVMGALQARGVSLEDARDYAVIGCVEPGIPGKSFTSSDAALFNLAHPLELVLQEDRFLPGSLDEMLQAYARRLDGLVEKMAKAMEAMARCYRVYKPLPFLSALTESCLARGLDVTEGGADYNAAGLQGVGLANVADSLSALETLVFEQGKYTLDRISEALQKDFRGEAALLQEIRQKAPFYGNDTDRADRLAARVAEIYCRAVMRRPHPRGSLWPGLYSVTTHVPFGLLVGALPCGRGAYETLSVGVSPAHGSSCAGPTALLNSAAKIDYTLTPNGVSLNLRLSPSIFSKEGGAGLFAALLKGYFDQGGMQVQADFIDRETLSAARDNPDAYRDLVVRVAGYSAYFTELSPIIQDEIIRRS